MPHPGPGEGVCSGARWVSEARWPVGGGGGALVLDRWGHGGEAIGGGQSGSTGLEAAPRPLHRVGGGVIHLYGVQVSALQVDEE